jgi:hypothetical protein
MTATDMTFQSVYLLSTYVYGVQCCRSRWHTVCDCAEWTQLFGSLLLNVREK